jgi:Protein of unknown function (DUF3617)
MTPTRVRIALAFCVCGLVIVASAEARKAGLWTITTVVTTPAAGAMAPHSTDVCITQALLDKFGAPLPKLNGDCRVTRLDKKADRVSAEMVCTGATVGKATMLSNWTSDHATGSIHFVGTGPQPTEWTSNSTSVFKSADCGSVKPFPMPEQ